MRSPLAIVVGFLGAGKTTFLRELLPLLEAEGMKPYVLINDYANARVDASSLRSDSRSVAPINGNCICCDSILELVRVLLEIPEDPNRIVLVEANGTTDPTALIEHLLLKPELRARFSPLMQVAMVDTQRWQKRHWHNELERLQVETASHILFTHEDAVTKDRLKSVREDIQWFNPDAEWITHQGFARSLKEIVAAAATTEPDHPQAETGKANSNLNTHKGHAHGEPHDHHHHDDRHALSHAFVGMEIALPDPMRAQHLQAWLQSLPPEVLRVKGVVRFVEEPDTWMKFNRVDALRGEATVFELPQKPIVPACAVLIGVRLDEPLIRKLLNEACAENPLA